MTGPALCGACAHNLDAAKRAGMQGFIICDKCAGAVLFASAPPPPPDPWAIVREWLDRSAPWGACDSRALLWDGEAFGLGYETQDGIQRVFADGRPVACPTIEALAAWCAENQGLT